MSRRTNAGTTRDRTRDERRKSLDVLLGRAERGVISPTEAALLRSLVGAEIAEGDAARRAAGGQQAAVRREQQRVAAAEAAIVEAEQHAADVAEQLRQYRAVYGPEAITTYQAAVRRAEEAEARAARIEEQRAEEEARAIRYANWLAAAQRECGAPNWPALPETIRDRIAAAPAA
ncbi:hypothetical protein PH213_16915 [Streptomyces sp. SRF1]|uniref:hypothetical protein n=1 Tax=Streptomyces sp. SRF1 TaxID=1549642 RepID=UPI0025B14530|nr:hypothetical protein [Streptomyces sp. SRF1]MDN3056197.1 hypothetical protein [Streptomyces sp. SRF1]